MAPKNKAESTMNNAQEEETNATQEVATRRAIDEIVPEIMGAASRFNEEELRDLTSFDDAVWMSQQVHGAPVAEASDVLGDGFAVLDTKGKARLCGVPLLLMDWAFRPGAYGRLFVSVRAVSRNQDGSVGKYIINDGSTGIAEQLAKYTKRTGTTGNLMLRHGLRASEYEYTDEKGVTAPATTYYLDTSA